MDQAPGRIGVMSHGDRVTGLPPGYSTQPPRALPIAAMENPEKGRFGVQYPSRGGAHRPSEGVPERFLFGIAGLNPVVEHEGLCPGRLRKPYAGSLAPKGVWSWAFPEALTARSLWPHCSTVRSGPVHPDIH
jgi:hypothetical protein